jgi:dipeptidase E
MKLLLTSGGLRNKKIIEALQSLLDKPFNNVSVAFIPTALNTEPGDKGWAIDQMQRLRDLGIKQLDIVDIAAVKKDIWLPRLEESDVIFVNGGNTTYLMDCFNKSGLTAEVPKLLETRVFVGASAGSYIATPDIRFNTDNTDEVLDGLGLVDFGLQAHLYSPKFPQANSLEIVKRRAEKCPYIVYALDDQMAVKVDGNSVEIVGEGKFETIEPKGEG